MRHGSLIVINPEVKADVLRDVRAIHEVVHIRPGESGSFRTEFACKHGQSSPFCEYTAAAASNYHIELARMDVLTVVKNPVLVRGVQDQRSRRRGWGTGC